MNPLHSLSVIPIGILLLVVLPTTRLAQVFSSAFTVGPFTTNGIYRQWSGEASKSGAARIAPGARASSSYLLMAGKGVAKDYSWIEEYAELEVKIKVPKETRAKDLEFEALPTSVGLFLRHPENGTKLTLLDPTRKLCGSISVDGTYWDISDDDEFEDYKEVTVTLEKKSFVPTYGFSQLSKVREWKGVFKIEEEGEVTVRDYQEPEEFDVRDYAARMGVDLDNLNMSNVDKSMFGDTGLSNATMIKELLAEGILRDDTFDFSETNLANSTNGETSSSGPRIPFLDTDSKWHSVSGKEAAKEVAKENAKEDLESPAMETGDEVLEKDSQEQPEEEPIAPAEKSQVTPPLPLDVPVDRLTVASLKQMLRLRGLDVSGETKELKERLREALLMESRNNAETDDSLDRKTYS